MIKKHLFIFLLSVIAMTPLYADEGMWTLYNLPAQVYSQMRQEGFSLSSDALYNSPDAIKNSVVSFGGFCSGVVVSPDGLVLTNHHCGFDAIRRHSTVGHDYLLNGFYAKNNDEELPNEDLYVSFMIWQKDITDRMNATGIQNAGSNKRDSLINALEKNLNDSVKSTDSTLHVEVDAFYEGNRYYVTAYRDYRDVRLVFAPTFSIGKFGGDTDNWMWPRQTCDFSVFRIYVNPKTGAPADYSKDNVPYHPANYVQVSLQGYQEGSFAMTIGYPGTTSRYLSSYGIKNRHDAVNEPRIQVRGLKQKIMKDYMTADEAIRIKYDSKYASSSNYWKNAIGMNRCIDSMQLINQKQKYEAQIKAWVDSTGYLKGKLDFKQLSDLYARSFIISKMTTYFKECFLRGSSFSDRAIKMAEIALKTGGKQVVDENSDYDENVDKDIFVAMLEYCRSHIDSKYLPDFYSLIDRKYHGDCRKYADRLYKKSVVTKFGKTVDFNAKNIKKDPGLQFGTDLLMTTIKYKSLYKSLYDSIDLQEKYLCDAKMRMEQDMPHYSDANSTMRLSYGQVRSLSTNTAASYYTTPQSLLAKMEKGKDNQDYFAEQNIRQLIATGDYGRYADSVTKTLNLCYLTTNDITGGNSGSPMFNGKGELMGLAFDGNWDALSSDINFDRRLTRCIGVDIRYVLYIMDKWGGATRLINEINPK